MRINITKSIRLRDRKMGRENAMGMAHYGKTPIVELDPRLGQQERLSTLVHELLHIVFPDLTEDQTLVCEQRIASVIWHDRWRRLAPEKPPENPTPKSKKPTRKPTKPTKQPHPQK